MSDDPQGGYVRPLDEFGNYVESTPAPDRPSWLGPVVAVAAAVVTVAAIGGFAAWRALAGSPYGAAEVVAADADILITMDFMQFKDVDRVERLVLAFAEPMAQHDLIDEAPDFEAVLRELDDEVEAENGYRPFEDAMSWIGKSGAVALWLPDDLLPADPNDPFTDSEFLVALEVRDQAKAEEFVDEIVDAAREEGVDVAPAQVGSVSGYEWSDDSGTFVLVIADNRLLLANSAGAVSRAIDLEPNRSVVQTEDFRQLANAVGDDALLTFYAGPGFAESVLQQNGALGITTAEFADVESTSMMMTTSLDDDGVAFRMATPIVEDPESPISTADLTVGPWVSQLPADTYGYFDMQLPESYFAELAEVFGESLTAQGVTEADLAEVTNPVDDLIGMSLIDDLLPTLGGEMLFAVVPADDSQPALGDVGLLAGIGLLDAGPMNQVLDRVRESAMETEGVEVTERGDITVFTEYGDTIMAVALTDDAALASTSPDLLGGLLAGDGGITTTERYHAVDALVPGNGLVGYVDIESIVGDFVDDDVMRDVLAPLVAAGAGGTRQGDVGIVEFRLLIDY